MQTLKEAFESMNRANVKYVVISNHIGLPSIPVGPLEILTIKTDDVVGLMGLIRRGHPEQYVMPDNPGFLIHVYEKGKHVFPDVFEAAILKEQVLYRECIKVPGVRHHGIMVLWRLLFHQGAYKDQPWIRNPLMDHVEPYTGKPMRTRYKSLNFTP